MNKIKELIFRYKCLKSEYGGIIGYIKTLEKKVKWYESRYCGCWLDKKLDHKKPFFDQIKHTYYSPLFGKQIKK